MELTGKLDEGDNCVFRKLGVICGKIESEMRTLRKGFVKDSLTQLYNDLSALVGTVLSLCQLEKTSSQATCVLARAVLDSCISIFAFCKNPKQRALLYKNFTAILDWKFVCLDDMYEPVPSAPKDYEQRLQARKKCSKRNVEKHGEPYLNSEGKGKTPSNILTEAIRKEKEGLTQFRNQWYPERRRKILQDEGMGWVYDTWYIRFCSAIHSDSAASRLFAGTPRRNMITLVFEFWSAAICKIVDTFKIRLSSKDKYFLRIYSSACTGKSLKKDIRES